MDSSSSRSGWRSCWSLGSAAAQEAEALRRELEQLRRQQEQYQKAIEALSERLKRLESQPAAGRGRRRRHAAAGRASPQTPAGAAPAGRDAGR